MRKNKIKKIRSLVVRDMILRGSFNGGKMRDRRKRRLKDKRNKKIEFEEIL